MQLKISTSKLQVMLSKAMRGSSNNKMIPLTGLLSIEAKEGILTLITTDATNYLFIRNEIDVDVNFSVVVVADLFFKLISKLTCDYVEMSIENDILTVVGNGEYKIELPLDEEGSLIKYPDVLSSVEWEDSFELSASDVSVILNTAKASLATSTDVPCYTGYYISDKTVTTDTQVLCGVKAELFDKPCLLYPTTVDLLDVITTEKITCSFGKDKYSVRFDAKGVTIYGKMMDCIDDYQIDVISELLDQEFESSCRVNKNELMQLLDRVSLFVGVYDKNCVYLTFTEKGLLVQSMQTNSSELLKYVQNDSYKSFTCCIDVEMLKAQIKAYTDNIVEIQYGADNAIKLVSDKIVQVVCLQEDDR